ncbi:hypothetical protein ACRQ5Q_09860 [Bradyrhizobium sp. PMVTL-01]|uniref:hypothetical protein n=1 Tax=Bradyrhizobium sp. PMVTL-01 TaxID=3434999 RepID=UPI003F708B0C
MLVAGNAFHVARSLQVRDDAAEKNGIKLLIGFDFHEYVSIARATPTKGPTFPNFRPDRSPIKEGEGYWIIGLDKNNNVAGLEAARLYDLSQTNFAEHLQSLKAFYANPAIHAHPEDRCICTAPSAKKMTGKVAYHGDLWVRRDFRGQGVRKILTGLTHAVSFAMWAPDFLCAIVERWTLDKNVDDMLHHEPGGAILRLVEDDIVEDNWLSWETGEELRSWFDRCSRTDLSLATSFSST